MMAFFRKLLQKEPRHGDTLSGFFKDAETPEKRRVMEEIIEKANQDQRDLVERHRQMKEKTA